MHQMINLKIFEWIERHSRDCGPVDNPMQLPRSIHQWSEWAVMDSRVTIQPRVKCIHPVYYYILFPPPDSILNHHLSPNFQRFWPCYTTLVCTFRRLGVLNTPYSFLRTPINNKLAPTIVQPRVIQILNIHFLLMNSLEICTVAHYCQNVNIL